MSQRTQVPYTYASLTLPAAATTPASIGNLISKVYMSYAAAPEQFRNISQEILSLYVVYKKVEEQLRNQGSGAHTLSAKGGDDLKTLHAGLQTIL